MSLAGIFILALLSPVASAQIQEFHASGLTLTFAPSNTTSSCSSIKNATAQNGAVSLYLDTDQLPVNDLCLNLSDLFSQNTSTQTGNANNSAPNYPYPNSIPSSANWTSYGGDYFDPTANYTHVWYYQQNATGSVGEGQYAALGVTIYPFKNCAVETAAGLTGYQYTCQSGTNGQCDVDSHGIQSVSFAVLNQTNAGSCYEFKQYPSSGSKGYASMGMASSLFVLGAIAMLLM